MIKNIAKMLIPKPIWIQLRLYKLRKSKSDFKNYNVTNTYGGHRFTLSMRDPISVGWYGKDWTRLPEIEELSKSRLKSGARVFDCGAHQSVVAMMLAKEVGDLGKVVAVEASPHNYKTGMENVALNGIRNLTIVNKALGASKGILKINEGLNASIDDGSGEWGAQDVVVLSLNDLIEEYGKPDVIFIDIEGFEGEALKGASEAFKLKCDWFIEVHGEVALNKYGSSVKEILSYFSPAHYELLFANEESEEFKPLVVDLNNLPSWAEKRFYLIVKAR